MAGCDLQKALSSPAVRSADLRVWCIVPFHLFVLVGLGRLVFDEVVQNLCIVRKRRVGDRDVSVGLPHGQSRMCHVPFAMQGGRRRSRKFYSAFVVNARGRWAEVQTGSLDVGHIDRKSVFAKIAEVDDTSKEDYLPGTLSRHADKKEKLERHRGHINNNNTLPLSTR